MKRAVAVLAILLSGNALHAAEPEDKEYAAYSKAQEIGRKLYQEFMHINGPLLRVSAVLKWCEKEGLAKAVEAKITDRNFEAALRKAIQEDNFQGEEPSILLQTQSVANSIVIGYSLGYRGGLSLRGDKARKEICDAAPEMANQILK